MNINIVVKLQIEWIHKWQDCAYNDVLFLKDEHRHIFYIKCILQVSHSNRDVEIIRFKREIQEYLRKYTLDWFVHIFWNMSCEMIAIELIERFWLISCEVLEDNENWALVVND